MFTLWVALVVVGAVLQIIGVALTVRHVRARWRSTDDGRTFRAYLMEPPRAWATTMRERTRLWWQKRRRRVVGRVDATAGPDTITVHAHAHGAIAVTGSVTVERWPNAKNDPEGFAAAVQEKLAQSNAKINKLQRELATKDQEIESTARAELLAVKQSVDQVASAVHSSRLDGLRTEFMAAVFIGLGVTLAALGGTGLLFWT